jgi:hypothetical protein
MFSSKKIIKNKFLESKTLEPNFPPNLIAGILTYKLSIFIREKKKKKRQTNCGKKACEHGLVVGQLTHRLL